MKIKNLAIIQARVRSTRLPGKVLLKIFDKTILEHVVSRIKKCRLVNLVVVATTTNSADSKIASLCKKNKIPIYRGSEEDVLDRYYQVAKLYHAKNIIRITSDCPLIDPIIIDDVINAHLKYKVDYTSNTLLEKFPDGEDIEIFKFATLEKAWVNAKLKSEREHVTPYMRKHCEIFKLHSVGAKKDYSGKRWTLDEAKDFLFIEKIYKYLYKNSNYFGMKEILKLLYIRPELERINSNITRNEGYLKSLQNDKIVKNIL